MCSGCGNPILQGVGRGWVGVLPSSDLVLEKRTKEAGVEGRGFDGDSRWERCFQLRCRNILDNAALLINLRK